VKIDNAARKIASVELRLAPNPLPEKNLGIFPSGLDNPNEWFQAGEQPGSVLTKSVSGSTNYPTTGKRPMHQIVSILQWLAKWLLGARFAENQAPRFRGADETIVVAIRPGEDHWARVGWMKVRLLLEKLGGPPCPRMALARVPSERAVNLRAKSIHGEPFVPETSPPSYLRNVFPPPEFPGR
jgi:hypothetical protein